MDSPPDRSTIIDTLTAQLAKPSAIAIRKMSFILFFHGLFQNIKMKPAVDRSAVLFEKLFGKFFFVNEFFAQIYG